MANGKFGDNEPDPIEEVTRSIREFFENFNASPLLIGFVLLVIVLGYFLVTSVYIVDRDQKAVVLRFGEYNRTALPGWHWKFPSPIEKKYIVNTQRVFSEEFGYRSGGGGKKTRAGYDQEALMLTGDLGVARVEWDIQYRKTEPKKFLFNIRNERKILREASFAAMRRVVGDYDATEVITVKRQKIAKNVKSELQEIMDSYNSGINILDVIIQSSEPPKPVLPAFKEVDSARQDREKIRNEALQKKERILNEAEGQVARMLAEAQGDSAAMLNRARGDARRFEKILTQYRAAPEVTETRMFLETMEGAIKRSGNVYVVDKDLKNVLPMLDLKSSGGKK
ncbi:MAG: FtsH protease activity modulator HflK [bacterium]